ncbi:unnamed protein product [Brachionus calyciflorus]|uniref:Uncharacterized protein n=1 Tax=Brachionus calyciflorus TaxID=104777 RepID=A0A813Q7X7_9BILA|nr:unnamed protein product [Brachionus calyciflorus]
MFDTSHDKPSSLSSIDENNLSNAETDKKKYFLFTNPKEALSRLFFGYHNKTKRTLSEEAECGDEVSVCTWINDGVNPDDTDAYGYTPLLNAAVVGRLNAVNELIKNRADVNKPGPYGFTPLHAAAQNGHSEIASILIKNGAKIDAQNDDLDTPMHLAIKSQQIELVLLLLKNGSNPKIEGFQKKDCFQCAMECGLFDVAQTLENFNPALDCNNNNCVQ